MLLAKVRNNLLLVAAGILIGLILAELLLQMLAFSLHFIRSSRLSVPVQRPLTILCVGDSVTFGYGDSSSKGYPGHLEEILSKELGSAVVVVNRGRPGASIATVHKELVEGMRTIPTVDLVIVLTGNGNSLLNFSDMYEELLHYPLSSKDAMILKLDHILSHSKVYSLLKGFFFTINDHADNVGGVDCAKCLEEVSPLRNVLKFDICEKEHFNRVVTAYQDCLKKITSCGQAGRGVLEMHAFCGKALSEENIRAISKYKDQAKRLSDLRGHDLQDVVEGVMQGVLADMVRLCKQKSAKVLLLTDYPSGSGLLDYSMYRSDPDVMLLGMQQYFNTELHCHQCKQYFFDDAHPNREGYRHMAGRIAEALLQKGWGHSSLARPAGVNK